MMRAIFGLLKRLIHPPKLDRVPDEAGIGYMPPRVRRDCEW